MKVIKFDGNIFSVESFMKYVGCHNFIMMERGMASTVNAKHAEPICIDGTMHVQVNDMAKAIADAIEYCGNGDWFSIAMAIEPLFGMGERTYQAYEVTVYEVQ